MKRPISILDLHFIDIIEDLPGVIDQLKILITQLRQKITHFCKQQNLIVVIKMREIYCQLLYKMKELNLRVSMPMCVGIFMLQQLKK